MYANDPELRARLDQIVEFVAANFQGLTGKVAGEGDQTRKHVDRRISDLAGWTRDDANGIRASIIPIPHVSVTPANTRPAPTNAGIPANQGCTVRARTPPRNASAPAAMRT